MPEINRSETLQKRLKNHAALDFFDALRQIFNVCRAVFVGERRLNLVRRLVLQETFENEQIRVVKIGDAERVRDFFAKDAGLRQIERPIENFIERFTVGKTLFDERKNPLSAFDVH